MNDLKLNISGELTLNNKPDPNKLKVSLTYDGEIQEVSKYHHYDCGSVRVRYNSTVILHPCSR